ncbi:MAG: DUF1275 domain-containing protein [Sphingobium sp.]|nr:DUF1275 domain-containing protein [Sphingobium sp.]
MATKAPAAPPLPWLLLLLSVTTGLVDAVSVLGLGKVFTANMTGNIVFLGFAAAATPGYQVPPYLVAIGFFVVGALIAGWTGRVHAGRPLRRWLITASLIEAALLWGAAAIAIGYDVAHPSPTMQMFAIIALTAVTMGFRNATIRQLKIPDLTTTVLTLTITGLAADSTLAGGTNPNWGRRVGSVLAIFMGAALGAWMVLREGLVAPLIVAGLLILGGTLACALHPSSAEPAG